MSQTAVQTAEMMEQALKEMASAANGMEAVLASTERAIHAEENRASEQKESGSALNALSQQLDE